MSFTFFDKFADACSFLRDSDRALMFAAICEYGAYGEEPNLPYPLDAMFASFREDIDNSKQQRERGNRGGRPRKTAQKPVSETTENQVSETAETGLQKPAKPVSENQENQFSETSETGSAKPQKPVSENPENQVCETSETRVSENAKPKPNQTKLNQTKPKGERGARKPARRPPTPEEVAEYVEANGLSVDATRFCDYFAAQGWRLANGNPMRDWHAAARNWSRREAPKPEGVSAGEWDQF